MRSFGWNLIQYDWCPYKTKGLEDRLAQREDHTTMLGEGAHPQAKETGLRRSQLCWHLDLRHPASRIVGK